VSNPLIAKYNVPGPRYTSYPTVPYWDVDGFSAAQWLAHARRCFEESNDSEGVSVYIHLPFCETPCTFCGCCKKFTRNHDVEEPYAADVIREWSLYCEHFEAKPRIRELHIGGGTPTFFSASNLSKLMDSIMARAQITGPVEFSFEGNPSSTTEEHLRLMRAHGFRRLSLGVQDFDPVVQRTINRIQTFEEVARVTEAARRLDYSSINFDLIYGLPCQQLSGLEQTMEKVVRLRPERIAFYGYAHVPWVPEASQRRFSEAQIPRGEEKRALYEMGRDLLFEAGYHEIGMDHFALENDALYVAEQARTLHRNFMGYTALHSQLCIGLGMSAISDAWYAFAQNEKSVEAYHARVNAGELPVFRGHNLTAEDLVLRRHILDLMCKHEADLARGVSGLDCGDECIARLDELIADDVVELDGSQLRITRSGRPFLRNVCMAFDARLWRGERSQAQMFSDTV